MRKPINFILNGLRYLALSSAIIFGLLVIVGTSDEEDPPETLNTPPTSVISSPADGSTFAENAYLTFGGTATDAEDGTVAPGSLSWSSDIDGVLGIGPSLTTGPLSAGTHMITLTATDSKGSANSTTISISIIPDSNTLPTVTIDSPADNSAHSKGHYITFSGSATDTEDGALEGDSLVWRSSIDGVFGAGSSVSVRDLSSGTHIITLTATDKDDYTGTKAITITVDNLSPTATISYPADGATLDAGASVTFVGTGTDTEDGTLMGNQMEWRSDQDGKIGIGKSPTVDYLSMGNHIITLTVTDNDGASDSARISITVENTEPEATINYPSSNDIYSTDDLIYFEGIGDDDEDGMLTGGSLVWKSSIDGFLGSGTSLSIKGLTAGLHIITLTVTDRIGAAGSATVNITVQ